MKNVEPVESEKPEGRRCGASIEVKWHRDR